jgi:hypothetical protein
MAAARAVESLGFGKTNLDLARYWLSRWKNGAPPLRADIAPRDVKKQLPGIAILEWHSDGAVMCRLAGSALVMGLGIDITGMDMIAITPPEFREVRMARYRRVANGAVSRCAKPHRTRFGATVTIEDILLPLESNEGGSRQILYHADWRPQTLDRTVAEIVDGMNMTIDESISIVRAAA